MYKCGVVCAVLACLLFGTSPAAGLVVYRGVSDLTSEASQIVIGDVVEVSSYWDSGHDVIKSQVVVSVATYLVGSGTGTETLEVDGGTVDDTTLYVSVLPVFQVGDHVLLFLGGSEIRLVESFQGAYLTDGTEIMRMAPACGRAIPETRQPLADFLAEILAALPPGTTLPELTPYQGTFLLPIGAPRYGLCGADWTYQANPMGESYKINANCADASAGDAASQIAQIQNGTAAWNAAGADFAFTYGGTSTQTDASNNGTNLVYFDTTPPGGGGYIAVTYYWMSGVSITEADLVFNDADYTWWNGSGSCSNKMDIWNIATHEFGHWLCLADLYGGGDSSKTMYGYGDVCQTYARTLHSDDINGIVGIYGVTPGPANNNCANATVVGAGTYSGTTVSATNDGTADCGPSSTSPDVWYKYIATGTGTMTVDTCAAASFNTVLSVHSACPGTIGNQIACNNDSATCGGGSTRSYLAVSVTGGVTYYIRVAGRLDATGTFTLTVTSPADTAPPTPNPMTFETAPTPNGLYPTTIIDMVATTATDPTLPIQYAFEANTGPAYPGADSRDWGVGLTYSDTGLTPNTTYDYRAKARDGLLLETTPSPDFSATTYIETPAGVSFGTVTANSIVLNATGTLTNLAVGSSGAYFDSTTTGGDGGINAWVQNTTDTATGLSPDTSYTFQVKARNQSAVETPYSGTASKWTLALVPTAPTLGSPTTATMTLNVNPNGNPVTTTFAVRCTATNPSDASWSGKYVNAAGNPSATAVWQTDAAWGTITVQGLQPDTMFTFAVKARNGDGVETAFGPGASLTTLHDGGCPIYGDINMDGVVDGLDIAGFVRAKLGEAPLPEDNPACADYGTGDLNLDIAYFVADLIG